MEKDLWTAIIEAKDLWTAIIEGKAGIYRQPSSRRGFMDSHHRGN